MPEPIQQGKVNPLVEYYTVKSFFMEYLGYDPNIEISVPQWLTFTEHRLLGVTSGRVFHDDLGLNAVRKKFIYYPDDIWRWMMASEWKMIAGEEAFVGRCGSVGDDLGSRIVAARQIQRVIRLCFLMEKRYSPYSKWFGTAFKQLAIASKILPFLQETLDSPDWTLREKALGQAYSILATAHNALAITSPLDPSIRNYFGRPFQVISADRFVDAIKERIKDPQLRQMPMIGTVSQFTESVAINDDVRLFEKLMHLYR